MNNAQKWIITAFAALFIAGGVVRSLAITAGGTACRLMAWKDVQREGPNLIYIQAIGDAGNELCTTAALYGAIIGIPLLVLWRDRRDK